MRAPTDLRSGLVDVLNTFSAENRSNTSDGALADFLLACLIGYEKAVQTREGQTRGAARTEAQRMIDINYYGLRHEVREILLRHDARHALGCPQKQQNYWRLRGEYRPADYGPDRPCTCGLDDLLGRHDMRMQG